LSCVGTVRKVVRRETFFAMGPTLYNSWLTSHQSLKKAIKFFLENYPSVHLYVCQIVWPPVRKIARLPSEIEFDIFYN
jgi:hypothetical protein